MDNTSPRYAWTCLDGLATTHVAHGALFAVELPRHRARVFRVFLCRGTMVRPIAEALTLREAQSIAEVAAPPYADLRFARRARVWQRKPATAEQTSVLRLSGRWREGLSRGEAARLIAHEDVRRLLHRYHQLMALQEQKAG